tara:strand:- start:346 stop:1860 length:1515 start_codon:yes stop_codon:yes gene_type:complete
MTKIKFKVVPYNHSFGNTQNTCYLRQDNWDDFNFKTTFELVYIKDGDSDIKKLGYLRIMVSSQESGYTPMPEDVFNSLSDQYCSLGNDQSYYEEIMGLEKDVREQILSGLRDCVYDQSIYEENKNEAAMRASLMRGADEYEITKLYKSILDGNIILTSYRFKYLVNENEDLAIKVNVEPYSNPPSNVHVLIGRNGAGKTRILSGMADELTKNPNPAKISQKGKLVFSSRPGFEKNRSSEKFANLVTIVFSAFDHFKPIRNNTSEESIPCTYVGLKTDAGNTLKSQDDLNDDFMQSVEICLGGQRQSRWTDAIKTLNSDPIFAAYSLQDLNNKDHLSQLEKIFDELSSGHKIILLTITKLVELVNEKTLVLIDEPENHLHPPLLSSFLRAISDLLIKRNGVGLVATHSPVVLQEVPQSCVTKIDRVKSQYSFTRPKIETYGENIDTLTRDVFGLEIEDSGFYKTIKDYIEKNDINFEDFMQNFQNKVGSEGVALARSNLFHKAKK